jgi:hypothetical protein
VADRPDFFFDVLSEADVAEVLQWCTSNLGPQSGSTWVAVWQSVETLRMVEDQVWRRQSAGFDLRVKFFQDKGLVAAFEDQWCSEPQAS